MRNRIVLLASTAVVLAGILLARNSIAAAMVRSGAWLQDVFQLVNGRPDSTDDAAREQLFQMRRTAVASMRADLLRLVAAEARFLADSGHYTGNPYPLYFSGASPGNEWSPPRLTAHGWWTTIYNDNLSMTCAVVVGTDTTIWNAPPAEPVCRSERSWEEQRILWPRSREGCAARHGRWDAVRGECRSRTM